MKKFTVIALAIFSFAAHSAESQEWEYKVQSTSPASGTQRPTSGVNKAELFKEKDGYTFRIRGNTAPSCYSTAEAAQVEEDASTLTITPTPRFNNCEKIRLVIKKDGSGGVQQQLNGKKGAQAWQDDETQSYGLTPR
jgi:hypothetical protein